MLRRARYRSSDAHVSASRYAPCARGDTPGQLLDRLAVGPGKTFRRSLVPRQPNMGKMLARLEPDGHGLRHFECKHMLAVMRRARWVTMTPAGENLINVLQLPIDDTAIGVGLDSGLLMKLACGRLRQCLARLLAACHRLPIARIIGTLEQ